MTSKIRVLVVDDSSIARRFITKRLERDPELEVVGTAADGTVAIELIDRDPPDVVVLDDTMPGMSGRDVLRVVRKAHPEVAIVMFSASVGQGTMARFEALYLGADDAVSKPRATNGAPVGDDHPTWTELLSKAKKAARRQERGGVSMDIARDSKRTRLAPPPGARRPVASAQTPPAAAHVRVSPTSPAAPSPAAPPPTAVPDAPAARRTSPAPSVRSTPPAERTPSAGRARLSPGSASSATRTRHTAPRVHDSVHRSEPGAPQPSGGGGMSNDSGAVIIASSTGGPDALGQVFERLPADFPLPILIAQHMPPDFTRLLAERLDSKSPLTVREAQGGEPLVKGTAYVAPGGHHLVVGSRGPSCSTRLSNEPPVNSCRPSADVLFRSAVEAYGPRLVAVVLSGMGRDGADGCGLVTDAGGAVICQDEATSVVWGMPGATVQDGWADVVLPIEQIAGEMTERARRLALRLASGSRRKALR